MAPLDLAVPFGTARADVAVPDAPSLDRKDEGERELGPVIGLDLLNGERERPDHLCEEVLTGEHIELARTRT